jgi:phosphoesterase RecJ-like protein
MDKKHKALKRYIEKAKRILIVSHRGPDMDAFCSMLLTKEFLNIYYPKKSIIAKAKQLPSFNIPRMHDITVVNSLKKGDEDLIIVVDGADLDIVCEKGDDLITTSKTVVAIDHHQTLTDKSDLVINEGRSSAAEQVICTFKELLGKRFKLTNEIAQLGQYGINADTGRFLYETTTPDTLRLYADLYEFSPIDLEEVTYKVNKFPKGSLNIIAELLNRVNIEGDMAYTYVNRKDLEIWDSADANEAFTFVKNNIIRYIQGIHWGFMIKPVIDEPNNWFISFRGTKGYQRVDKIAEALGGGGHMYASGAKIEYSESKTLEQVLNDTLRVVKENSSNL